ncbi:MAG: DUF3750 domain-containing protein [Planctomycetes bacterium]|nr:DUF3750 domain-containing protein [Planctomycetota bacterium]
MHNLALMLVLVLLSACRVARPSELPNDQDWIVAVKSCGIPQWMPWYSHSAEHTWIDMKEGDEMTWSRVEVAGKFSGATLERIGAHSARHDLRWSDEPVRVHAVFFGQEASRIQRQVAHLTRQLGARYADGGYEAWPGPNSNTFLRELSQEIPELAFAFDHNAVGKDYTWFDAGLAPSRTGVHLDTWPIGATIAAKEGLELHFLQLTFGLSVWPPRLKLPLLPAIPWERAPEPEPASRAPADGEQVIVYPFDDADSASEPAKFEMMVSVQPPITSGRSLRVESSTAHTWLSVVFKLTPSTDPAMLHSVRAETVVHWMGSTDLVFPIDLRRDGLLESIGPFALDGAIVSIQLRAMPDGTVDTLVSVKSK